MKLLFAMLIIVALAAGCSGDDKSASNTATAPATGAVASPENTFAAGEARARGWTMLGHNLASTFGGNNIQGGFTIDAARGLAQAWSFEVAGSVTGVPAVLDGRVYALASGGMYALDATSGAQIWINRDVKGTSSPTWNDGALYVNDSKSVLHRLDAATGAETWRAVIDANPAAAGFSSPVVADGMVIVGSASIEEVSAKDGATFRGSMVAFDAATGAEVWRHYTVDPPYNGVSVWSSPSVDLERGIVYGSTGNNYTGDAGPTSDSIFALDLKTGALKWNKQLSQGDVFTIPTPKSPDSDFGTNPILFSALIDGEKRFLVGAGQKSGMFWALDAASGEVVWSRKVSGGSALIGGIFNNGAFDGEHIIVAGNNGTSAAPGSEPSNGNSKGPGAAITTSVLMAMDPADGHVVWERQLPAWVWAPITVGGRVGFVSADRQLQAFDLATGATLFTFDTDGTIASGAAIVDQRIYFGSGVAYLGTKPDNKLHALAVP
jgi:polyvinyl alcohol dehydrogenase (cytochrome)